MSEIDLRLYDSDTEHCGEWHRSVRREYTEAELREAFGDDDNLVAQLLNQRAALVARVQELKRERDEARGQARNANEIIVQIIEDHELYDECGECAEEYTKARAEVERLKGGA